MSSGDQSDFGGTVTVENMTAILAVVILAVGHNKFMVSKKIPAA